MTALEWVRNFNQPPLYMVCSFFTFVQKYRFELFSENLSAESSSLVLIHNR